MSILVKNLSKVYGQQKAVDNITFEAHPGQIVGFLGPNGAGKSTTMKIATGYLSPSAGTVEVGGFDVQQAPLQVKKCVGYLPEHNPLYLDMYVKEYLQFIGKLHQMKAAIRKQRIKEMVVLCGLEREQGKKIGALSKGYRQRVGLAQALLHDPAVLILDEPTTGLDPNQIVEIRQVIKTAAIDKTIIFSTHIMQEVQAICDRAIIINLGKIVADSTVAALKDAKGKENRITVEFAEAISVDALEQLPGVLEVSTLGEHRYEVRSEASEDVRAHIFSLASTQQWTLLGLQQEEQTLETIFQNLTQQK
ncbi:MAG: gliding motility-associated ABC transporter ATP-binding subunit GldA [Thermonemataceae bacterium]